MRACPARVLWVGEPHPRVALELEHGPLVRARRLHLVGKAADEVLLAAAPHAHLQWQPTPRHRTPPHALKANRRRAGDASDGFERGRPRVKSARACARTSQRCERSCQLTPRNWLLPLAAAPDPAAPPLAPTLPPPSSEPPPRTSPPADRTNSSMPARGATRTRTARHARSPASLWSQCLARRARASQASQSKQAQHSLPGADTTALPSRPTSDTSESEKGGGAARGCRRGARQAWRGVLRNAHSLSRKLRPASLPSILMASRS